MKLNEIQKIMASTFQRVAIEEISVLIHEAITGGKYLQPYLFAGYAGLGKTHLVEKVAGILCNFGFSYVEFPVGCTASQFWTILRDAKEYTVFFGDEAHAMKCTNQLKSVAETGGRVKTFHPQINGEEVEITVDPSKWIFLLASNETMADTAISGESGRFQELVLEPYAESARVELIKVLGKHYEVELPTGEALKFVANNVRPFARAIKNLVKQIRLHCILHQEKPSNLETVKRILVARGYYPQGFTRRHIDVMKFIGGDAKGKQVQEIAASPLQGVKSKAASAVLAELAQAAFVATGNNGRKILTTAGLKYLTDLATPKAKASK